VRSAHPKRGAALNEAPVPRSGNPTVSVVIPTLNEAGNLPYVLNTLPSWVDQVVVVDGRSKDDTERIAAVLWPEVKIVRETRKGKGAALRAGFEAAKGDIVIAIDADGSMDGREIERFRDALLAGADYAKGSRFAVGGGSADITRFRRFGDWGICLLIRILFGAKWTDVTYGYFAIWADRLDCIPIDSDGFEVETLIAIRAARAGLTTVEVPCFESLRIHGTSNLRALHDGMRIFRTIMAERMRGHRGATV